MITGISLLLLSACGDISDVKEKEFEAPFVEEKQREFTPVFNPLDVSLRDKVGDMTITSINIDNIEGYGVTGVMTFQGKLSLDGTYEIYENHDVYGNGIVFSPTAESSSKLPLMSHDNRPIHIIITNQDLMKELIQTKSSSNEISIVISEYTIKHGRDYTVNEATVIPPNIE